MVVLGRGRFLVSEGRSGLGRGGWFGLCGRRAGLARGRCLLLVLEEGHALDGQLEEVLRPLLVETLEEPHGG